MPVWESHGFYLEEVWLAQQTVDINTQGMCGQLTYQTSTEAPKGVGIVFFNGELIR
jgi:hypothetical protein